MSYRFDWPNQVHSRSESQLCQECDPRKGTNCRLRAALEGERNLRNSRVEGGRDFRNGRHRRATDTNRDTHNGPIVIRPTRLGFLPNTDVPRTRSNEGFTEQTRGIPRTATQDHPYEMRIAD